VERVLNLARDWKEEFVTTDAEVLDIEQDELDVAPEVQRGIDGITGVVEGKI
jgi:ribose 5-phosphate isomerase